MSSQDNFLPFSRESRPFSPTFPPFGKITATKIFDEDDQLLPLTTAHLSIPPNRDRVSMYANEYTYRLVSKAKIGDRNIELFIELHRRAYHKYHFKAQGKLYSWDPCGQGRHNGKLLGQYERRWGLGSDGGKTVML